MVEVEILNTARVDILGQSLKEGDYVLMGHGTKTMKCYTIMKFTNKMVRLKCVNRGGVSKMAHDKALCKINSLSVQNYKENNNQTTNT